MHININELRDSSDFLNILLENISSAIYIVDSDLRVQSFNHAFIDIFKKPEDQIIGLINGNALGCQYSEDSAKECGSTRHCENCDLRKNLTNSFLGNLPVKKGLLKREFLIDGLKLQKSLIYTTKLISFKGEKKVLVIIDDITELEQHRINLEEQNNKLIELNNQKNKFLGIAAHDLRNPIGSVLNISEILSDSYEEMDKTELESMFKIIGDVSRFSLNLINDLLDISKIEAGMLELKLESRKYPDFLKDRLKFYQAYARAHQMKVELVYTQGIPEFEFDDNKIEQVLNNLINNAVKFSLPGASITLSVSRMGDFVLTSVADNGLGIRPEELPVIFNEFQVSSTKASNGEKSTGLGLAIVKKIVEEHRGKVWATSQPGKGSTFFFTLPTNQQLHQN